MATVAHKLSRHSVEYYGTPSHPINAPQWPYMFVLAFHDLIGSVKAILKADLFIYNNGPYPQ